MVLDAALVNTQHYKVPIKAKVEESRERSSTPPYTLVQQLSKRDPSGHPRLRSQTLLTNIYKHVQCNGHLEKGHEDHRVQSQCSCHPLIWPRVVGHSIAPLTTRWSNHRLPGIILCGNLSTGQCNREALKKQFKDWLKKFLLSVSLTIADGPRQQRNVTPGASASTMLSTPLKTLLGLLSKTKGEGGRRSILCYQVLTRPSAVK